jgi:hypothetical protein
MGIFLHNLSQVLVACLPFSSIVVKKQGNIPLSGKAARYVVSLPL